MADLKETLSSEDPNQWRHDQNVISGLRKASLQLQVQSESCPNDVCTDHGYTGYDHRNSDGGDQWTVPVDNNEWWQCAEACSHSVACQGWTLVYNGQCYPAACGKPRHRACAAAQQEGYRV